MPQAIFTALIPPLAMALLLTVLSYNATQQPVALVVQSSGPNTLKMEQLIRADTETYALRETDESGGSRLIANQEVAAVITIPPDFERNIPLHAATLIVTLNNVDIDFSDDIRRSVARSIAQFDAPQLGLDGELNPKDSYAGQQNPYHINIDEDDLRQTNVDFIHYQVMPVLVLLVLSVGMIGTALLCAADGQRGTARLLAVSPVAPWAIVSGRLLGGTLAALLVLAPAVLIGALTHAISPPAGHWPVLCEVFLATALTASGLGAVLGAAVRGTRNIAMASSVLATYLFFLGGGFTTIAFLPHALRTVSAFNPFRYAIDGMRQALFYPDLTGLPVDLAVLGSTACLALIAGAIAVRRGSSA